MSKERFLSGLLVPSIRFRLLFIYNTAVNVQQKVIVINPGHGIGYNSGEINETTGVNEAHVNMGKYLLFLDEGNQFKSDNVIPELLGYSQLP